MQNPPTSVNGTFEYKFNSFSVNSFSRRHATMAASGVARNSQWRGFKVSGGCKSWC